MARSDRKLGDNRIRMEVLEKRVLYSADPVFAPLLEALIHPPEPTLEAQYLLTLEAPSSERFTTELVIVDVSTTDLHELYLSLQEQYAGSTTQVVAVEAGEDPFAQLSRLLEQYSDLDAIHLLSFGIDGQMQLGGESIGSSELLANSMAVGKWGDSLTDSGDLLLYGCNLSATPIGQQLAQTFSTLMRADVASSDDITGHKDLGGDWDLEIEFGQLETAQLLDQATQDAWVSKLDITTGLIAHYELESNGEDSAGSAYAPVLNNPDFLAGKVGNGIWLNADPLANPQYLIVDPSNSPKYSGGELTVAFWMNPYSVGDATIVDQSDGVAGYTVKMLSTGQIQVEVLQPIGLPLVLNSNAIVAANVWSQVSVTHSAGEWNVYVDDINNSISLAGSSFSDANEKLFIGENRLLKSRFSGALDDIRFYDRALTPLDVQELIVLGGGTPSIPNTEEFLPTNEGLSLENGQQLPVTFRELRSVDAEQDATELTFTINALVADFTVFLDDVVLGVNDTFTQEDVFTNRVSIAHDGIDASSSLLALTLDDGFGTSTAFDFSLTAAANLAPTDIVLVDAENDIGLELNVTDGDAAYFGINDAPTLFGGLDTLTYEVTLETAAVNPTSSTLVSYAATGSTPYFEISLEQSLGVQIRIGDNIWIVSTATAQSMMDGTKHSLAFTWDSATGDANLYVDGELTENSVFAPGLVLSSTGTGAVGNDIDASSIASFSGVLHDMRLFDHVRPQVQIAAEQDAEYGLNEPGLIGHWTFDSRTTSGQIGSEVGKHYLSLLQSTHAGAIINAASLANASVDENSVNGTIVGKVQGIDPERDALLSQILSDTWKIYYSESAGIFLVVGDGRPDWNDAYAAAANMTLNGVNGYLAMPDNAVEDTLLINAMNDQTLGRTWISATDEANDGVWMIRKPGEPDVQFSDSSGASVSGSYNNWSENEPNSQNQNENYLEVFNTTGKWNDAQLDKSTGNYFLAEFDVEEVLNGTLGPGTVQRNLTYSIASQSFAGTFAIDSVTGEIVVADGSILDHESIPSHVVTVEVVDNAANTFQRDFTIEVNELDEVSLHLTPGVQTVPEDGSIALTAVNANAIQVVDPDDAENLTLTLQSFNGAVGLGQTAGLTVLSITGTNVIVSGSVADLNQALDGLVYTPDQNFNGTGVITIETVRSSDYGDTAALVTNSQVNFVVTPAADNPVAVADFIEVAEGGLVTSVVGGAVSLFANDTDADVGAVLTLDSYTLTANGLVVIDTTGTFTYTHDGSETTTDSFQYTVRDDTGLTSTATVSITIAPVNDAPIVVDETIYVLEGGSVSVVNGGVETNLLANDSDPEGQPIDIVGFTLPAHASSSLVYDFGEFNYEHNGSENFSDSFTYYVSDGSPDETIGTVTVIVTPINDIPIANPDALSVFEGGTNSLLINSIPSVLQNDTDEESGTNLIATIASQPTNGVVSLLTDGTFSYTHDGSETTSDSFSYIVTDPNGAQSIPTVVSVNVVPVNNAPVATNDAVSVIESGAVSIGALLNDTDAENDSLTVRLVQAPVNGLATINADNTISYVHDGTETTVDSFVYSIDDGNKVDTATVNITVTPINDVPVAVIDSLIVDEGSTSIIGVLQNDTDAESGVLTPTVVNAPLNGTIVLNADSSYTYTHDGSETLTDSFTYFVTDSAGADSTQTLVSIDITPVNDVPVAGNDSVSVAESGNVVIPVLANDNDEDQDVLTVQIISSPLNGALTLNNDNSISYVHDGSDTTSDSFDYSISDGNGGAAVATVAVAISSVNDVPVAVDDTATVIEGGSVLINGLLNDTDSESSVLIPTLLGIPINGVVSVDGNGGFNYVHNGSETLTDSFTYMVTDAGGAMSPAATVTVTVLPVNDVPVALIDNAAVLESDTVVIPVLVNDSDADMDNLSVQINSGPTNGNAIVNTDQSISYTHDGSETTTDLITYSVADGVGGTAVATVQISILSVNDTPTAIADVAVVLEGGSANIAVLLNDTDAEVGLLSAIVVSAPLNGTAMLNADGTFTYVHNGSESTTDIFSYTVADVDGAVSASALVSITVTPVNDAPAANDDSLSLLEGATQTVEVLANDNDAEGSVLQPVVSVGPLHGNVTINGDNSFSYQHDGSENFSDQFDYTIFDTSGAASTATVQVSVVPVNDQSPIFTAGPLTYQIYENAPNNTIVGMVEAADGDASDVVSLALTDNAGGRFQLAPNGDLSVLDGSLLNREIEIGHVVVVTATDLAGNMVQNSIQINLLDEVESISVMNATGPFQINEIAQNGESIGVVSAVPTDDSGQVTYSLLDASDGRFSIDSITGEITLADTSLLDYEADVVHQIMVEALDSTGATITEQYAINIVDINEQPLFLSSIQSISIAEDVVAGESLLTLSATDPDGDDVLYAIESGDYSGAFVIDSVTGEISVDRGELIDYETQMFHSLSISVTDAYGLTDFRQVVVNVTNVDEPSEFNNSAGFVEFIENDEPVLVAPLAMIFDIDSNALTSVEISIANYHEQEDRLLVTALNNIASQFDVLTGKLTLTGPATVEEFNSALQQVQYVNLSEHPNTDVRQLTVTIADAGNSVSSSLNGVQVISVNDPLTGLPIISGDAVVGGLLSADVATMVDLDNIAQYHYQWMRDGQVIPGERGITYTPVDVDAGSNLSLWVSVVDSTDRLEPWMESTSTFIPVPEVEPTPEPTPEPVLAAAQPLVIPVELEPVRVEFEPIEAESIASVLSSTDFAEQVLSTEVGADDSTNVVKPDDLISVVSSEAATDQILGGDSFDHSVIALPDVVVAVSADTLRLVINPLVTNDISTVSRVIKLEAVAYEEQLASILSLDPLSLEVEEGRRVVWQVENVGLANSLTEISKSLKEAAADTKVSGSASEVLVGASLSVTAGFLIWMLRGGALLASVFSVTPLWKQLDPLPIVNASSNGGGCSAGKSDDENIETLFDQKS